jgi:hypothetical protein
MLVCQISSGLSEGLLLAGITAIVVLVWWIAKEWIVRMNATQKETSDAVSNLHESSKLLFERIEASQASYLVDKKVLTERLNAHAKTIGRIDKKQVRHGVEIEHLQSYVKSKQ